MKISDPVNFRLFYCEEYAGGLYHGFGESKTAVCGSKLDPLQPTQKIYVKEKAIFRTAGQAGKHRGV